MVMGSGGSGPLFSYFVGRGELVSEVGCCALGMGSGRVPGSGVTQNPKTGPQINWGKDSYLKWRVVYFFGFGSLRGDRPTAPRLYPIVSSHKTLIPAMITGPQTDLLLSLVIGGYPALELR